MKITYKNTNKEIAYILAKKIHRIACKCADSIMRKADEDMLHMLKRMDGTTIQDQERDVKKLEKQIFKVFEELGICSSIKITKYENIITIKIHECTIYKRRNKKMSIGLSPFLCPFIYICIELAKRSLGKGAQLESIESLAKGSFMIIISLYN